MKKNEETYRNVFTMHFPDEERADGRPAKTSPVYDKIDAMGAVWGQRYGWERANWFAPQGVERKDQWSFRRTNYFEHVGNEVQLMREKVGIIDLTPFTKHEVTGPGAEAWLDSLVANKVPTKVGRMALSHALTRTRRHPLGVHDHQDRRPAFLRGERGRCRALRRRLLAPRHCPRTARSPCATSPPRAAASCSRDRSPAKCSRS